MFNKDNYKYNKHYNWQVETNLINKKLLVTILTKLDIILEKKNYLQLKQFICGPEDILNLEKIRNIICLCLCIKCK